MPHSIAHPCENIHWNPRVTYHIFVFMLSITAQLKYDSNFAFIQILYVENYTSK